MCGLLGIINNNNFFKNDQLKNFLNFGLAAHNKRGPDNQGMYLSEDNKIGLAHNRLNILDLSKSGNQPMMSENKDNILVFNGEIYNFRELLTELGSTFYNVKSDTRAILEYFTKFGIEKLINKISGMYAFSIYSKKNKKIFLARDFAGKKPLYLFKNNHFTIWSSTLFPFQHNMLKSHLNINRDAVFNYFEVGYVPSPLSIFQNISKINPGELIEIDVKTQNQKNNIENFYKKKISTLQEKKNVSNLSIDLIEAVKKRTISDVPYGTFLSSGIDSALVTSILSKNCGTNNKVQTFSIGIEGDSFLDESKDAKKIAKYLNTNHHEIILNENDLQKNISVLENIYDEPFSDSSQIPTYIISKFASNHVKVILSGDGGDEIFGGYNRYTFLTKFKILTKILIMANKNFKTDRIVELIKKNFVFKNIFQNYNLNKFSSLSNIKSFKDFYFRLIKQNTFDIKGLFNKDIRFNIFYDKGIKEIDNSTDLQKLQLLDFFNYLNDDILTKVDRASMANSLEVRCPFLDINLRGYIGLDDNLKIKSETKLLLRRELKKYLPEELINKNKKGFAIPIEKWMKSTLKTEINDLFASDIIKKDELISQKFILNEWQKFQSNNNPQNTNFIWSTLIYLKWKNKWFG